MLRWKETCNGAHCVVGSFPDGNSALMLVAVRLRHIARTHWGTRRYLNTDLLKDHLIKEGAR